jgi:hypothetical protein
MFHIPEVPNITIYQVNPQAKPALREFFLYLYQRHEKIQASPFEKMEAIYRWKNLLYEHVIWLRVANMLPAPIITSEKEFEVAAIYHENLLKTEAAIKFMKAEMERYLLANPGTSIEINGVRYSLQSRRSKEYSIPPAIEAKMKAEKEKYVTGHKTSTFLKRTEFK